MTGPIERRLREAASEVEAAATLAGPAAARQRGERRQSRRRAATGLAATVVLVAGLLVGGAQVQQWRADDAGPAERPAPTGPTEPSVTDPDPLPPEALPWAEQLEWQRLGEDAPAESVFTARLADAGLYCPETLPAEPAATLVSQDYRGSWGSFARYELWSFVSPRDARLAAAALVAEGECGATQHPRAREVAGKATEGTEVSLRIPEVAGDAGRYRAEAGTGPFHSARVYVAQHGHQVAVLRVLADPVAIWPGDREAEEEALGYLAPADCLVGLLETGAAREPRCPADG